MAQVSSSAIEEVTLSGQARERGIIHGEQLSTEIKKNVEIYLDRFDYLGADKETVQAQAQEFTSFIEDKNEEYFREMEGIAEGSDVPLNEIVTLNARWEVMYSALANTADDIKDADGCTSFGVQPEVTTNGHTYMGQNWDWIPPLEMFIMDIQRDDKPNMVAMTEAGIVGGKIGINEHGVGVSVNGLISESDGENPYRKPMHVRLREVLDAERLDTAIKPLITTDRVISANIVLGHAEGEFVNLELTPEHETYFYPDDGIVTHANHFENKNVDSKFETLLPDTLCRAPRIRRLLSKQVGQIDNDVLSEVLRDHFGKPASICRHIDENSPEEEQYRTNGSFILDLTNQRMFATQGPPCQTEYRTFEVAT